MDCICPHRIFHSHIGSQHWAPATALLCTVLAWNSVLFSSIITHMFVSIPNSVPHPFHYFELTFLVHTCDRMCVDKSNGKCDRWNGWIEERIWKKKYSKKRNGRHWQLYDSLNSTIKELRWRKEWKICCLSTFSLFLSHPLHIVRQSNRWHSFSSQNRRRYVCVLVHSVPMISMSMGYIWHTPSCASRRRHRRRHG